MKSFRIFAFYISAILVSCQGKNDPPSIKTIPLTQFKPEFARGFVIDDYGDHKTVTVFAPYQGASEGVTWYLVPKGSDISGKFEGRKLIETPVESIVCTSTTHIPLIDYLDIESSLVGFPNLDYITSPSIRERIDKGQIQDLGEQISLNLEMLVSLEPDMVMGYSLTGDLSQLDKIEQSGIPVVLNSEYLESHPLGRAEWIKFMAVFFNKSHLADSIFENIKNEYLQISATVIDIESRPTVLSGVVYGDTWFLPGGNNYASKIIKDAGGSYIWENDSSSGYLELGFESVYSRAYDADFWIGVASYNSLEQLIDGDSRYAQFKPYSEGGVYSYNKRTGPEGGNEYLELGYLRPDLILKDLVTILHPDRIEKQDLYFYKQLK